MENQTEKRTKVLRTDNGTEYESNEFNDFCREARIKKETTTMYTPEKNGIAERKNRTIVEDARAMLCDQGFPKTIRWETSGFLLDNTSPRVFESKAEFGNLF